MASVSAIGRMTTDALNRIKETVGVLHLQFGVEALDLAQIRNRDSNYQHAQRLEALATWMEDLTAKLDESGIDMTGAAVLSNQLGLIRHVLDLALNAMTVKNLAALCEELHLDFHGSMKQEYVNVIVAHLTGEPIKLIDLNKLTQVDSTDAPDTEGDAEQGEPDGEPVEDEIDAPVDVDQDEGEI